MVKNKLTKAERAVLNAIRDKPYKTQRELMATLNIARPTVATYIERLQAKGYIHGRAYILADELAVCCIGGMNMDRTLQLKRPGILATSNPAISCLNRGGVARNVAENLARLSVVCKLLSVVGDDEAGKTIVQETSQIGVDTSLVFIKQGQNTGSYSAVMSPDGELFLGISDLEICVEMNVDFINKNWNQIAASRFVFADANIPEESLNHLLIRCRETNKRLALDTVSAPKARRIPQDMTGLEFLFCNFDEALAMVGQKASTATVKSVAEELFQRGVENVIVSVGGEGICIANASGSMELNAVPTEVIDVSGAGDAMIAGIIFGQLAGYEIVESCGLGMTAASMTMSCIGRNCPNLTAEALVSAMAIGVNRHEANKC